MNAIDPNTLRFRHLVRTLVFIDDDSLLDHVVETLKSHGFTEITTTRDPDELGMALRSAQIDLVIAVSQTSQVFIGHFIRDLRHGLLDCHPFPIVLMLLPSAEIGHVREVVDSGVDDLLITPLEGETLIKRLGAFLVERRPFTVTHDYIGPNRRLVARPGTSEAPLIRVPNPVRARASGQDEDTIQQLMREATIDLNHLKIRRDGFQIGWLVTNLTAALDQPGRDVMAINGMVSDIADAAIEIFRRANRRTALQVKDQAKKVVDATRAIVFTEEAVADPRINALLTASRKLSALIEKGF